MRTKYNTNSDAHMMLLLSVISLLLTTLYLWRATISAKQVCRRTVDYYYYYTTIIILKYMLYT